MASIRCAAPANACSTSPTLRATAPGCCDASSSWRTMSALLSVAFGPSSHWMAAASSPFLAAPMMVGDHGDGIVDAHHLAHALDRARRRLVQRFRLAAEHRRDGDRRDPHARQLGVDAVIGAAVDLVGRVQPLGRRADQGEVLRILQRDAVGRRHRQRGGVVHQLAVAQAAEPAWSQDHAVLRPAGRRDRRPIAWPRPRSAGCGRPRRPGATASRRRGPRTRAPSTGCAGSRWHRARHWAAHAPAGPGRGRPPAPPPAAWRARCRCPGPSRPSASPASPRPGGRCG